MLLSPVADQRVLVGTASTLTYQYTDADGTAAAPAGTVTVGITKADGTVLVAAGTATSGATTAPRTYALAAVNTLEMLTVTWTDGGDASTMVTHVEVVGGYFFSVAGARATETALADVTKYPASQILSSRREVEDEAERICGQAFVPRYRRVILDGSGTPCMVLPDARPRTIRSVTVRSSATGTYTYTANELLTMNIDSSGRIERLYGQIFMPGIGNTIIEYEHGWDRPPSDLVRASLIRLRSRLNIAKSDIPDRAARFVGAEGATFILNVPTKWRTGIDDVDAVYQRYSLQAGAFG